jgi:hypothetical protein
MESMLTVAIIEEFKVDSRVYTAKMLILRVLGERGLYISTFRLDPQLPLAAADAPCQN